MIRLKNLFYLLSSFIMIEIIVFIVLFFIFSPCRIHGKNDKVFVLKPVNNTMYLGFSFKRGFFNVSRYEIYDCKLWFKDLFFYKKDYLDKRIALYLAFQPAIIIIVLLLRFPYFRRIILYLFFFYLVIYVLWSVSPSMNLYSSWGKDIREFGRIIYKDAISNNLRDFYVIVPNEFWKWRLMPYLPIKNYDERVYVFSDAYKIKRERKGRGGGRVIIYTISYNYCSSYVYKKGNLYLCKN